MINMDEDDKAEKTVFLVAGMLLDPENEEISHID